MSKYPEQFIDKIKSMINIKDLISGYVPTVRKGRDYWACCPFHNEKTPSFQIKEDQQFYKCYGCGKSGDIFTFMMDYNKLSFLDAIETLAKKAGLDLPEQNDDPSYIQRKAQLQKIYNINKEAARFYHNNLKTKNGEIAVSYYASRGFTQQTIVKFGLGYSTDFDSLPKYLLEKGYDESTLIIAGIVGRLDNGRIYDFFGKRIVIPIIDYSGKVIGFSGRALETKPDFAKYKNTAATLAFNKRKNLFAINMYKQYKQLSDKRIMVLVEGHLDVISLYQSGICNAVASMGTSLTTEQCKEIKRHADVVYVSFDGDSAGQDATLRGLDLLKNEGLEIKVVCLKNNMDPDDYVKEYGKAGYEKLLSEALPYIDFKLKKVEEKHSFDSYNNKLAYAKDAIDILRGLDVLEREIYVEMVAKRCGLSKETILEQSGKEIDTIPSIEARKIEDGKSDKIDKASIIASRFVLASMFFGKRYALAIDCDEKLFFYDKHKILCNYIQECARNNCMPMTTKLFELMEGDEEAQKIAAALDGYRDDGLYEFYTQSVRLLRKNYANKEINRLVSELNTETNDEIKEKIKEQIKLLTTSQPK